MKKPKRRQSFGFGLQTQAGVLDHEKLKQARG